MTNKNTQQLQELYDKVAAHLITQGEKSTKGVFCKYRGEKGLMCAAGCLIDDENYDVSLENSAIYEGSAVVVAIERSREQALNIDSLEVLLRLQHIHDGLFLEMWETGLRNLAKDYELDTIKLDLAVANKHKEVKQ